ncbi:hypothetical protein [Paenibacillus wynnii]|uniref:hypothetical protein n=1 Tax=Paenibacillus wynnii TaxID=268407 RepID=UPI000AAAFAEC|nr:hypothetical protein [Paenibacillus wynnii]
MLGKRRVQFLYLVSFLFIAGGIINWFDGNLVLAVFSIFIGIVFGIRGRKVARK